MSFLAGLLAFLLSVPGPTAPHCDGISRCSDGKQTTRSVGNFNRERPGHEGGGNPTPDDGNNGHGNDPGHNDPSNPGKGHGNNGGK
jgi:hypothetical protein